MPSEHAQIKLPIVDTLISETLRDIYDYSIHLKKIRAEYGLHFVDNHFKNAIDKILNEIELETPLKSNYASLSKLIKKTDLMHIQLKQNEAFLYQHSKATNTLNKKYLVNIIFPARNSAKHIKGAIEFLLNEIDKSFQIDFNVLFIVDNTIDNTLQEIITTLNQKVITNNISIYVLETTSQVTHGISNSFNIGFEFFDEITSTVRSSYTESFFSMWEDEVRPVFDFPDSIFNTNINELLRSPITKAISGYMIDSRKGVSYWHNLCQGFSSDLRFIIPKPYIQSSAGVVIRWVDFPKEGIFSSDWILCAKMLIKIGFKNLKNLNYQNWPTRLNVKAPLFHPTEKDILKWTTKYMIYQVGWEESLEYLKQHDKRIAEYWNLVMKQNRDDFHNMTDAYLPNLSPARILDREFIHYYFRQVKKQQNKRELYEKLKKFRNRSYNF